MAKHLQRDLDHLKREILEVGGKVEEMLHGAIRAFAHRDAALARQVVAQDDWIDRREVEVEEDCLKILALHQPVAADLRFIVTAMKVNNDLERIGDHACNLAERAIQVAGSSAVPVPAAFTGLFDKVPAMVRDSLDALVHQDAERAKNVCLRDREVDETNRIMFHDLQDLMKKDPASVEAAVSTLSASRQLERIADLATNIAEDVVFLVEGEVVRHRLKSPSTE
ncbi:MAG: phosphate signaling complex protein PhoU [Planctomycetes bacterium]|nr:phosphate signaling complex protein PhoU [Planctomycetota bacterium]